MEVKKLNLSQLGSLNLATILEFRETVLLNLEYHLTIYCQNKSSAGLGVRCQRPTYNSPSSLQLKQLLPSPTVTKTPWMSEQSKRYPPTYYLGLKKFSCVCDRNSIKYLDQFKTNFAHRFFSAKSLLS